MSASAAYATYPLNAPLDQVMATLGQGGFDSESICLLLSPSHPIATMVRDSNSNWFEGKAAMGFHGLMKWLSEFGAVLIPSFGFFARSSKFFHALGLDRNSISACGQRGTLLSLGFSPEDAERFEEQVREIGVLVYVACQEATETRWAFELLRATGAAEAGLVESDEAPLCPATA